VKARPRYRMISWVAEMYNVHPQTLRLWEREGLLCPTRSEGNTRLYDDEACQRLEAIITLTRDLGVNLAGVEIILNLRRQIADLAREKELLGQAVRQLMQTKNEGPRYHALVRVPSSPLQVMIEE
jgi:MerR family transcriptional regulator/heat shock protein HspR